MAEVERQGKKRFKNKKHNHSNPRTAQEQASDKKPNNNNNVNNTEESKQQQQQRNNNDSKWKRKEVFPYGNYRNYYGYRIGQEMDEDPRLKVMKREWFAGRDCLDIGCNNGIITIHIAKKFHCRSILGLDIDSDRIADANWHLRKIVREENAKRNGKVPKVEVMDKVNGSEKTPTLFLAERKEFSVDDTSSKGNDLFNVVSFQRENFVQSRLPPEKQYDTILCLSVTKWIHLNWGDDGLITVFSKIWRLLRPGGILVLEPQPWQSYEKNRLVSETATKNYRTILLRPDCFQEILLDKIGFRSVEDLTSSLSGSKDGFKRPIFAFHK